nr:fibulin-2-like [Anolis sagrei ordinatus]
MKPEVFLCLLLNCCFLHDADCKSPPLPDCQQVQCPACPANHKAVFVGNQCCPRCIPSPRCLCPPHLKHGCPKDGYLRQGESVYIDFGTQKCTCISPNNIQCASVCPEIPPTCKYIGRPMDGCGVCACRINDYHYVEAGGKIEKECETCVCPPDGGELECTATCKKVV